MGILAKGNFKMIFGTIVSISVLKLVFLSSVIKTLILTHKKLEFEMYLCSVGSDEIRVGTYGLYDLGQFINRIINGYKLMLDMLSTNLWFLWFQFTCWKFRTVLREVGAAYSWDGGKIME